MTSLLAIGALVLIIGLAVVSIFCWIRVVIYMFQKSGVLSGLAGIVCGLYALYWGWKHADELGIRKLMTVWTIVFVLGLISNFVSRALESGAGAAAGAG